MPAIMPASLDRLEDHEVPAEYNKDAILRFLEVTSLSEGAESSNAQSVFLALCQLLGVPSPSLKRAGGDNMYCFEEDVKADKAHRRIDVYYVGHFVFEAKQGINPKRKLDAVAKTAAKVRTGHSKNARGAGTRGTSDWLDAMEAGRTQAGNYAIAATKRGDPKPVFLIVADIGYRFWIWSSFQPDAKDDYGDFEIDPAAAFSWDDLLKPEVFHYLRMIWLAPESLDEDALGQRVTAEIAATVSKLAIRLEKRATPREVGDFLMKCVFTMFAEGVGLIPRVFASRLDRWIDDLKAGKKTFVKGIRRLWKVMNEGGDLDSGETIKEFNGYLFKNPEPIDLSVDELIALREAAQANWRKVSPAIFGTLLERALSAEERHKLGAHYTPEAYIRRLVEKTMMEALRSDWARTRSEMDRIARTGAAVKADGSVTDTKKPRKGFDPGKAQKEALEHGHRFRRRLASIRVLDPACGSGNFLYVAMKEMKRLEGEVERTLLAIHRTQNLWLDIDGESVRPIQFWGIEIKPWAAKIAELVLWIGYLQWQVSAGRLPRMREPLIQDLHHIKDGDALIAHDGEEPLLDKKGKPVMRARGVTDRKATRQMEPVTRFIKPRIAAWPSAEFIIGNPPFLGNKRINDLLGSGYVDAIKAVYPKVSGSADFVMWWWWRCANLVATKKVERFGLVTTNSITQKFDRIVVTQALEVGVRLVYAIPDHPWYDEGAAVRIALTVGTMQTDQPVLGRVTDESRTGAKELDLVRVEERPVVEIHADLSAGADVAGARALLANQGICYQGMNLVGEGFRLSRDELESFGYKPGKLPSVVHPYVIGKDLVQHRIERYVIDFYGLEADAARLKYPELWNHLVKHVKPARATNNRANYRNSWWLFGETRPGMRRALDGLPRYIATIETGRHRIFQFLSAETVPDHKVYAIASSDAFVLGVLSSRTHLVWALATGGHNGVGNDPTWTNTTCFLKFPFPDTTAGRRTKVAKLAEGIDAHRKVRLAKDATLTLTDVYGVLAKLRAGQALEPDEEKTRKTGMVDTLRDLHDQLDLAVLDAYGWTTVVDDEIRSNLVELNTKRAKEEAKGKIRYLRPEFQEAKLVQTAVGETKKARPKEARMEVSRWPGGVFERVGAVVSLLKDRDQTLTAEEVLALLPNAEIADVRMALQNAAAAQLVSRIPSDVGDAWMARG